MNPEHAQIYTIFELVFNDLKFTTYINLDDRGGAMKYLFLATLESTTFLNLGGDYQDFGVNENAFWDWKTEQEKYGNIIFWMKDIKEIYALSLPRKGAILFYGLWKISKYEGIKSSWK